VSGNWVKFQNSASPVETVNGLLAKPEGEGPFPAVILLHSAGGLTDAVAYEWPDYLTKLGYVTLSVDTFGSRGLGYCGPRSRHVTCGRGGVSTMVDDAYGAIEYITGLPSFVRSNKVAVMGFSMGGAAVNSIAAYGRPSRSGRTFVTGIAMYGSCEYLYNANKETMPLVQIIGEHDDYAGGCKFIGKSTPVEVHVLANAYHAFDNRFWGADGRGNAMRGYNAEATNKARDIVKSFLEKHLGK
jgi:dienelactone hydrolase